MKRDLTEDEVKKTKAGIDKLVEEVKDMNVAIEYAHKKLAMLEVQWAFEDYETPISRKNTRENSKRKVVEGTQFIDEKQNIIDEMQNQIKNGVSTVSS